MESFSFAMPTRLHFGKGQIAALARELPADASVLITAGGGSIRQNGVYDQVLKALAGRRLDTFWGIEPNPTLETLMQAVAKVRAEGFTHLLAVGGGSVLDGTKFIAAAVPYEGDPWDICARRGKVRSAVPLGCVLTLPATGSEMNSYAVISRQATQEKLAFGSPLVFPAFAILDPETTFSLPPRQVTNGVVDAFVHVMEQYLTFPADAPLQDRFAESILQTLVEEGPKALAQPQDYAVRANLMLVATMALNGLIGIGVPQDWSTHTIGHELTAFHGLDHAQTLAIVLPNLMWVQRASKEQKLLQYGTRVWGIHEGTPAQRTEQAIIRTREFFEAMGQKTHLSDYGIGSEQFEAIVTRLKERYALPMGERRDLDEVKLREILQLAR